jgi:hypothetical protein
MRELHRVVGTLQQAAADPELRGPLALFVDADGEHDLRMPPRHVFRSSGAFMCGLRNGIREFNASAVGIVLPVRTLSGKRAVCDYADAEGVILVAAEAVPSGVLSAGMACPLHELPKGWVEAHEELQWLARPLREALASAPLEDVETF